MKATETLIDLIRVETRLYNLVDAELRASGIDGLTLATYEFLQIVQSANTCRVIDIAVAIDITVGAASKGVDRMVAAGWCVRSANPRDRRSSVVSLTPAGRGLFASGTPLVELVSRAQLDRLLTTAEQRKLASTLAGLRGALWAGRG